MNPCTSRALSLTAALFFLASGLSALNPLEYWLMPFGRVGNFTSFPGPVPGQHTFWSGTKWGKKIFLQGSPAQVVYDVFECTSSSAQWQTNYCSGGNLYYWGTFRGNDLGEISHKNKSPMLWMKSSMSVGETLSTNLPQDVLEGRLKINSGTVTMKMTINQHFPTYTVPETGVAHGDVLKVTFDSGGGIEEYWLKRYHGWIRATTPAGNPSGGTLVYTNSFNDNQSIGSPREPWYLPFASGNGLLNGFFEDVSPSNPPNGGSINSYLPGWSANSADGVVTTDNTTPSGATPCSAGSAGGRRIALKGQAGGGDSSADTAYSDVLVPFGTYRLSGWLWRSSTADNVYLDFNDGLDAFGSGPFFTDGQAMASQTNTWECRSATVTIPNTLTIRIRAVRDGANSGNAYFDGVILQRID